MPKIKLYQIDAMKDDKRLMFLDRESLKKLTGSDEVDSSIYDLVYEGNVNFESLENIFVMFNYHLPDGYIGRSMSVSDVVEIGDGDGAEPKFYYCDRVGFTLISFDPEKCGRNTLFSDGPQTEADARLRVVLVKPNEPPKEVYIRPDLETMQQIVAGYIEVISPYNDGTAIVCNEEAKIFDLPPNRALYDKRKNIVDVICGDFFVVGARPEDEDFSSLTSDQVKKYLNMFRSPEKFLQTEKGIRVTFENAKSDRDAR